MMTETPEPPLEGIDEAVRDMLARLTPAPPDVVRQRQHREDIVPRLNACGFPELFWDVLPLIAAQKTVKRQAEELCKGVGAIVALAGVRGTGKTSIASQIAIDRARAWLDFYGMMPEERAGKPPIGMVHYCKATDLVARFKPLFSDFGSIETAALTDARAYECREWALLVIDELHECDDLKMKDRVLTDLIDRRYSARTDTLLISNQSPEDFRTKTNPSVLSRLGQHGRIIACNWRSFRTPTQRPTQ